MTGLFRSLSAGLLIVVPLTVSASYQELSRADAALDIEAARARALTTVSNDPASADAVAAALWWLHNTDSLADPADILEANSQDQDPEVGFILGLIKAALERRAPVSSLATAELAGPFGQHGLLDLERQVVPIDSLLPPLGRRWFGPAEPFRLRIRAATGRASPPEPMFYGGVYLAAWTLSVENQVSGWLVVESASNIDIEIDDRNLARLRSSGQGDPVTTWYSFKAAAGFHRVRISISDINLPSVRIHLIDDRGSPLGGVQVVTEASGPWAHSTLRSAEPPAAASLRERLLQTTSAEDHLLAATLARGRGDNDAWSRQLTAAMEISPDDPYSHLALARYYLTATTGLSLEIDALHARTALGQCRTLAMARLLERQLAQLERRPEDAERLLEKLIDEHPSDPRVLRAWVQLAVRRGWTREADEALDRLRRLLPDSRTVTDLELAVLEALERWPQRAALLHQLATRDDLGPRWVEQLAGDCFTDQALAGLRRLQMRVDDPVLDIGICRLLVESGRSEEAHKEVHAARQRWGNLVAFDQIELVLVADSEEAIKQVLNKALLREPADLKLRTLQWRLGSEPFYAPFRLDEAPEETTLDRSGLDSAMLLDQAVERLYPDGSSLYYYHGITLGLTPEGARQAATLQQFPDAELLQVRIIKPDGRVVIPPELSSRSGTIILQGVTEGDIVEEEYVAAYPAPMRTKPGHISPYIYRFADPDRAVGLSEYVVLRPRGLKLEVDGNLSSLEREELDFGELVATRWRATSLAPIPREPLAPPSQELLPWATYSFNTSWRDVGDVTRDRVLWLLRSTSDLRRWAQPMLSGELAPAATLELLVSALCDEVEQGSSDLELGTTAGESFSSRRGNRLIILATVLVEAGWSVDLVLTRPRPFAGTHLTSPSFDAFTVPLLRVATGGQEVWIDLTEEASGVAHISPMLQAADGLVLSLSDPHQEVVVLDELPSFANPGLEDHTVITAKVTADGSADLTVDVILTGPRGSSILDRLSSIRSDAEVQVYTQLAVGLIPAAEQVSGSAERTDDGAVVHLEFVVENACNITGQDLECRDIIPAKALVPALASLPERRYPLILLLPVERRLELTLIPPEGYSTERPPRRLNTAWGSVTETIEMHGSVLHSSLVLNIEAQTIEPEDYPAFARFCQAVDGLMLRAPVIHKNQ